MGHERVDRTLPLNEVLYYVRKDAELRRRWREDFDSLRSLPRRDRRREADRRPGAQRHGVHQYYVSQIPRLTFGAAGVSNAHPALEAFRQGYPEHVT